MSVRVPISPDISPEAPFTGLASAITHTVTPSFLTNLYSSLNSSPALTASRHFDTTWSRSSGWSPSCQPSLYASSLVIPVISQSLLLTYTPFPSASDWNIPIGDTSVRVW